MVYTGIAIIADPTTREVVVAVINQEVRNAEFYFRHGVWAYTKQRTDLGGYIDLVNDYFAKYTHYHFRDNGIEFLSDPVAFTMGTDDAEIAARVNMLLNLPYRSMPEPWLVDVVNGINGEIHRQAVEVGRDGKNFWWGPGSGRKFTGWSSSPRRVQARRTAPAKRCTCRRK